MMKNYDRMLTEEESEELNSAKYHSFVEHLASNEVARSNKD
jgi:hypothetical protein